MTLAPPWSVGAGAAVVAMAAFATGDVVLAGVLLCVAARDAAIGPAVVLACLASLVRWGTPSLAAVGADQAVLGIAGAVGPPVAAASAWIAAAALVVAPRRDAPLATLGAGVLAALLVAGPSDVGGWWIRVAATLAAVLLAAAADRLVTRPIALGTATVFAAAGLAMAALA